MEYEGCCYLKFHLDGDGDTLAARLAEIGHTGIYAPDLVGAAELPLFDKFDALLPKALLQSAYATDRLDTAEAASALRALGDEWGVSGV